MDVRRIADGLWRWTAPHPEWTPTADWPRDVGCVLWEAPDAVVLVDPLVPAEADERRRFLDHLDADVERVGRPVAVLLTCEWHRRSADELAGRYGASVLSRPAPDAALPAGVRAVDAGAGPDESVLLLSGAGAVVPGDTLLGDGRGGVTLCPEGWLGGATHADLAAALRPLLDEPVEHVLVSHGEPVVGAGLAALRAALAGAERPGV